MCIRDRFTVVQPPLLTTALYWFPLNATVVLVTDSVVALAPEISAQVPPLLVLTCHWITVGAVRLVPAMVNVAVPPSCTLALEG